MSTTKTDLASLSAEELIKLLQEKQEVIDAKDKELADSESYITELKESLTDNVAGVSSIGGTPTVTCGKDTYMVAIHAFTFEEEKYTTKDLLSNEELVAALVEIGSGVLVKLEKNKK